METAKKTCCRCKVPKDTAEFCVHNGNKDGLNDFCRDCNKAYHREHYKKNKAEYLAKNKARYGEMRQWFHEIKSNLKCEICGEDHPACLDFHHRDPEQTDMEVSRMLHMSKKRILAEIAKCAVWCCKCHRKWHWEKAPIVYG